MSVGRVHHFGGDHPRFPFPHPHHCYFPHGATSGVKLHAGVFVLLDPAHVRLVNLHRPRQQGRDERLERLPDALLHEPRRLLRHTQIAV
ncbi:MAG: hypothetical protein OXQ32_12725 [bacterium]|nr:hypothetical protein [bacterium]